MALLFLALAPAAAQPAAGPSPLDRIHLPSGFRVRLFAGGVEGARSMALGDRGTLFVGTLRARRVYAIRDRDGDGVADEGVAITGDFVAPNGVAFRNGDLYVADGWRILRFDDIESHPDHPPKPVVVYDGFPHDAMHGWKYLRFGPDGLLYVPVGSPCDTCDRRDDPRFGTIQRMKPDGTGVEVFARGIRNSVGFDFDPKTKDLWFTDNGADRLGDDAPPDELNHAPKIGMDFGFPYCHAGRIPDPQFGKLGRCDDSAKPAVELGAHVAALGMRFYTGKAFPPPYRGAIFLAEHGSWVPKRPIGYRVMIVHPDAPAAERYQVFADGWLEGRHAWGRPVDVLVPPDGSLLVSDEGAGAIYRITYEPSPASP